MMAAPQLEPCVPRLRRLVDAHFGGTLDPDGERRMRAHLPGCERCRRYYERHLLLEKLDPAGLGAEVRIARGLGLRPRRKTAAAWAFAGACAAAALTVALVPRHKPMDQGFAARGGPGAERAEVFVYRTSPSERLQPHATIRAGDDLAFAYTNAAGFRKLLVYGVDEHRHVYWYFPAWVDPKDDPHAVGIAAGPGLRELPEAIRHDFDGHELTLHAVFVDDDMTVRRVEHLLAESTGPGVPAAVPGSFERELPLVVER
jgi:hypothetical protein